MPVTLEICVGALYFISIMTFFSLLSPFLPPGEASPAHSSSVTHSLLLFIHFFFKLMNSHLPVHFNVSIADISSDTTLIQQQPKSSLL